MKAFYSILNKDITIYNEHGVCLIIIHNFNIYDVMDRYGLSDKDIYICF